jgi:hypothetical protein
VLATALALDRCLRGLEDLGARKRQPAGSADFLTGGFKTRGADLTLDDLLERLEDRLAVAPRGVVQEYGMTELTSQAYTRALAPPGVVRTTPSGAGDSGAADGAGGALDVFFTPPWMRVRVLDPISLDEAQPGDAGLIAVLDLGNVGSVLHLLTEDLGASAGGGFRLLGRASGAELRGCSLTAEELEAAAR